MDFQFFPTFKAIPLGLEFECYLGAIYFCIKSKPIYTAYLPVLFWPCQYTEATERDKGPTPLPVLFWPCEYTEYTNI